MQAPLATREKQRCDPKVNILLHARCYPNNGEAGRVVHVGLLRRGDLLRMSKNFSTHWPEYVRCSCVQTTRKIERDPLAAPATAIALLRCWERILRRLR